MMANQWRPILFLALFCASCSALRPDPEFQPVTPTAFSHASFGSVLGRFVDDNGRVDYSALQQDSVDLDYYYALIAQVSPDSHPDLFPTNEDKLAYWINAYNATVMSAVVRAYPISEVGDVGIPTMKAGFFLLQNIHIGGARTNLYHLENKVIRRRFPDPRIHFALNCASASCPTLRNRIFAAEDLDRRLNDEARAFINDERNVRVDHEHRTIHLSAIFDWYESDFVEWPGERLPKDPSLLDYLMLYASQSLAADIELARTYRVSFNDYDWSLNDLHGFDEVAAPRLINSRRAQPGLPEPGP